MRKTIKLFGLLMLCMSFALTSCGGDDDDKDAPDNPGIDNPSGGGNSSYAKNLVGKWETRNSGDGSWGWNLRADGSGYEFEAYRGEADRWNISWKVSGDKLIVTDKEDGYKITYEIDDLTSSRMELTERDEEYGNDYYTLYKVDEFSWE